MDGNDTRPRPGPAKQRILTAAARLFRRKGFARTTVRDLANEVGLLSGSLFHHFESKDDILFAVMDGVITDMDHALDLALAEAASPQDQLRALIHTQLAFIHGDQSDATTVLLYDWVALSPERQSRLLARRQGYFARWQEVLAGAQRAGLTRTDPTILRQLLHGATVWSAHWFDPTGPLPLAELEKAVLALVLKESD